MSTSSVPRRSASGDGAGEGIRTPDLLITNQLLYRPELRQPDKRGTIALRVPAAQPPTTSPVAGQRVKFQRHACLDAASPPQKELRRQRPRRSGFEHAPAWGWTRANRTAPAPADED